MTLTEQEIISAYQYPDIFLSYCQIEVTGKGLAPFKVYDYQKKALQLYLDHKAIIILKSRQLGFTTLGAGFALWKCIDAGNNVLFLSKREEDAQDILRKARIMYENLPEELKIPIVSMNATTIEFANKNRIQSLPATERAGAGKSASLIFLDEYSAFPSAKGEIAGIDVWGAIYPTISTGGQVIVQSTPKGQSNYFYNLWFNSGMEKIVAHWSEHPKYSEGIEILDGRPSSPWYREMTKNMPPHLVAQELDCDFVTSGRPVFNPDTSLEEVSDEDVQYNNHYAVGIDLASGSGLDYHVAQFVCIETGKQVLSFRSQDPIDIFALKIAEQCRKMGNPLLAFENNSGYGLAFMKEIKNYPNLYYQTRFDKRTLKNTNKLGWNTNVKTKELMINDLRTALNNGELKITDPLTLAEVKSFQYDDNDRMAAPASMHDDTVMALAIAWQAAKTIGGGVSEVMEKGMNMDNEKYSPTVSFNNTIQVPQGLLFPKKHREWCNV